MATKVKVVASAGGGSDLHTVENRPSELASTINLAIKRNEKFVTLDLPGNKKLSVIADRIEAIWEE